MFSISYPADEHYRSNDANGNPTYEVSVQVATAKRRIVNLYAFNNSGGMLYVKVQDTANGGADKGKSTVYPVQGNDFVSIATHGGDRMENGIWVGAFTDAACTTPAAAVMHYKVDYTAYF